MRRSLTTVRPRNFAAIAAVLLLCLPLSGCGTWQELIGSPATRTPAPPIQIDEPSPSATVPQGPKSIADLVGTWSDPQAHWTVRFASDGTFTSDYEGVTDFRNGTFQVHNNRLDLIGADGEVDSGRITGDVIVFRLGTLKRVS
jgi:polyisoprenoid-binding protein YceI